MLQGAPSQICWTEGRVLDMSLSCFTRISQWLLQQNVRQNEKNLSNQQKRNFFFSINFAPFPWGEVDNFWQDFFQMSAFLSSDIFCPLVPPLARCLKFKGRRKLMLLIWSYVLKSFKIYQLCPTSQYSILKSAF